MRWLLMIFVIAFAMPIFAGSIVIGYCAGCGYETDEFFVGGGMTPGYAAEVYRNPETGEFHKIGFNTVLIVAEEIAVTINNSHRELGELTVEEIAVNITNNHRGIGMELAEEIAVTINNNHREVGEVTAEEIAVNITNNHRGVDEIYMIWTAPEVLGELLLEDGLPAGVFLSDESAENPFSWELVNIDTHPSCPSCGENVIAFERVGKWD